MTEEKEYTKEFCKYVFSDDEKKEIASDMAQKISDLERLESEKKSFTKRIGGDIDIASGQARQGAEKLNSGYEMRHIECEVERDYDLKVVRYIRTDTGETVKEKRMTSDDLQQELFAGAA